MAKTYMLSSLPDEFAVLNPGLNSPQTGPDRSENRDIRAQQLAG